MVRNRTHCFFFFYDDDFKTKMQDLCHRWTFTTDHLLRRPPRFYSPTLHGHRRKQSLDLCRRWNIRMERHYVRIGTHHRAFFRSCILNAFNERSSSSSYWLRWQRSAQIRTIDRDLPRNCRKPEEGGRNPTIARMGLYLISSAWPSSIRFS